MVEEIFGPVLTIYVYDDDKYEETLDLIDSADYALTGATFASDRKALISTTNRLRNAAGNMYWRCSRSTTFRWIARQWNE